MCLHVETFSRWSTKYSKWNTQTLVMDRIQLFQVQLTGWPIYNASVIHFWTNQWSVQSKEDCTSAPQSVYLSTRRMSRAFWHDVFRYRMWLLKHKVRSKISQRNLASATTSIGVLFSRIYGSGNRLTCWQKCIHTVFEFKTLKPFFFFFVSMWTLFTQSCTALSNLHSDLPRAHNAKSSTKNQWGHFKQIWQCCLCWC